MIFGLLISMLDYTYICNNYKYKLIFYLTNAKQD